jgi:hypothetical protein
MEEKKMLASSKWTMTTNTRVATDRLKKRNSDCSQAFQHNVGDNNNLLRLNHKVTSRLWTRTPRPTGRVESSF